MLDSVAVALARELGVLAPGRQPVVWHVSDAVVFVIGELADASRACAVRIGDSVIGPVVLRAEPLKSTTATTVYSEGPSKLTITRVGARAWLRVSSPRPSVVALEATAETLAEAAEAFGHDSDMAVVRVGDSAWLKISSPGPSVAAAGATEFLAELERVLAAVAARLPYEQLARLASAAEADHAVA